MYATLNPTAKSLAPLLLKNGNGANPLDPLVKELKRWTSKRKKTDQEAPMRRGLSSARSGRVWQSASGYRIAWLSSTRSALAREAGTTMVPPASNTEAERPTGLERPALIEVKAVN